MMVLGLAAALTLLPVTESTYKQVLSAHKGRVVLMNFWATWCGPCREEMPQLAALQRQLGFDLITVSVDEPEQEKQAADFLGKSGVRAPAYRKNSRDDEKFIEAVQPKWSGAVPMLLLYDRAGKLSRSFVGEADFRSVEAAIRKLQ